MFTAVSVTQSLLLQNSRVGMLWWSVFFPKFSQMQVILLGMDDEMWLLSCMEIFEAHFTSHAEGFAVLLIVGVLLF